MWSMKAPVYALLCLLPAGAVAQPFSESMADCAALHQNAAQWVQSDATADRLMLGARVWAEAAMLQSRAEGRDSDEETILAIVDGKTKTWEAKGAAFFLGQEFKDWMAYCRSFAKNRGIDPGY
jgi:hypothetical protein